MVAVRYRPPTYQQGSEILQLALVTRALHTRAQLIAGRAESIAGGEGWNAFADAITVVDGTRPRGRSYSYVLADTPDGERVEFGDTNTERRRILRRAAG